MFFVQESSPPPARRPLQFEGHVRRLAAMLDHSGLDECLAPPVATNHSQLRVEPLYLDKAEAAVFLSVSVSTFEKLLREDATFPRPRALSANRNGYLLAELRDWGKTRPI